MSLFVAVRPDERAVEDLADAVDTVRRAPATIPLRWQPASQWHVTLAFLGAVDGVDAAQAIDDVAERLAPLACRPTVADVHIAGAGCFGRQVLWMGLAGDAEVAGLSALAAAIPPLLRGSGLPVDRRPWRGHLTIARARHGDAQPARDLLAGYAGPPWDASALLLVHSTGGPHPAHRVVHRLALAPAC